MARDRGHRDMTRRAWPGTPVARESLSALRRHRGALWRLGLWSLPEAVPAAVTGVVIAHAMDGGFLSGQPLYGLGWLALLLPAALVGALGTHHTNRRLGDIIEPVRDDLVRRVVGSTLAQATATGPATGPAAGSASGTTAVARLTFQVEVVRDAMAGLLMTSRGFAVTVVGAMIGMATLAPTVLPLVLAPVTGALVGFFVALRRAARWQRRSLLAGEHLAARSAGVVDAARDVAAFRAEHTATAIVDEAITDQADAERVLARFAVWRSVTVAAGGFVPLLVLLACAGWLLTRGLTAGVLLGLLTYLSQVLLPTLDLFVKTIGTAGLRYTVTLDRILAGLVPASQTQPSEPNPATGAFAGLGPVAEDGYDLVAREVTFRYGAAAAPVVHRLNLTIAAAEHLAIVGPSGSGKSTLAGLLCATLMPDEGAVLLGGVPVGRLPPSVRSARRVLIPQEAYVFTGTVGDNLRYLAPGAGDDAVWTAAGAVGADDLLDRLGGLDAPMRADRLSAGQRQLVALTRAYLSTAPVMVLDEATCHLDPAAEERVEEAFRARGGTLVVVVHRISSAMRADRVLVLDGPLSTVGTHRELLDGCELYRDLTAYWRSVTPTSRTSPRIRTPRSRPASEPARLARE